MIATKYFEAPELKIIKFDHFKSETKINESHRLTYSLLTLISREVADSLSVWADKGLISRKDVSYFEKMVNEDNDYLFSLYKKRDFQDQVNDDFETITNLFNRLAEKSLSSFQMASNKKLKEFLAIIYALKFIRIAVNTMCLLAGKYPDENNFRITNEKTEELQMIFLKMYKEVSNFKKFDFGQFDDVFKMITKMKRQEFILYAKSL